MTAREKSKARHRTQRYARQRKKQREREAREAELRQRQRDTLEAMIGLSAQNGPLAPTFIERLFDIVRKR